MDDTVPRINAGVIPLVARRCKSHLPDHHYDMIRTIDFKWREPLGRLNCPYIHRTVLSIFYSIRYHEWHASDDPRALHDHPWWYIVIVLRGEYWDVGETVATLLRAPCIRFYPASHKHYVFIHRNAKPPRTLLITGRVTNNWGFWVKDKFMRRYDYFKRYGHPACE